MSNLVSVIIPSYNHESFLYKALISVYNQTYSPLELIIIDDCSTDDTYKIAKELTQTSQFKERFNNIICISNEKNKGAHPTINKAISLSKGQYISILNSDDFYHPERIEKIIKSTKRHDGFNFAFTNYTFIDEANNEIPCHPLYVELQFALQEAFEAYPTPWFIFLRKQVALSTGNFFFSKVLWDKVGGFINLRYCHDLDFVLQCLRYTDPIFINEPLYYYRIHTGNTFSTLKDLALVETEVALIRYFKNTEYSELINKNAPCRKNYPLYFETLIDLFNLDIYYKRALTGYLKAHRVVDKNIFDELDL